MLANSVFFSFFLLVLGNDSNDLFIFADNSTFLFEAKRTIRACESGYINHLYVDYGRLLKLIQGNRKLGGTPILVGSHPPPNDTLWTRIENEELGFNIAKTIYKKKPAIMAFVTSGNDNIALQYLREALAENWKVELWFWNSGIKSFFI
jgi:hypothetical protein